MKKSIAIFLAIIMLAASLSGCAKNTTDVTAETQAEEIVTQESATEQESNVFVDSVGREVTLESEITRIAPSGSIAQMILVTLAPELLVGLSSMPDEAQLAYLPKEISALPEFGQFYGGKANLNMEALIAANPQIIIDIGNRNDSISEDMDMVQEQTGIPTVFIDGELSALPQAYRMLGDLLGRQEDAEILAQYIEKTLAMAQENSAKVTDRKTVFFGTGSSGLDCNAAGSSQADAIDLIGAVNAIQPDVITDRNGGTVVNLEQVYAVDPDVIILTPDGVYETLEKGEWADLSAVKNGTYYEIPSLPYGWMCMPPSINRVLGIRWLGNLLYPEIYDYDMISEAQEFYRLFWHYELPEAEAQQFLSRSTLK